MVETRSSKYGSYPFTPKLYGDSLTEETSPGTYESPPPVEILSPGTSDISSHKSVEKLTTQMIFPRTMDPLCYWMHRDYSQR